MSAPLLRFDLLTLFPALFDGFLGESILKRALDKALVAVHRWDIRDWAEGKHKQVDDRPFGGGPGMVLMAPPVVAAVEAVRAMEQPPGRLIALTPQPDGSLRERAAGDPPCEGLLAFELEGELFFGAEPDVARHLAAVDSQAGGEVRTVLLALPRARNPDAG